MTKLNSISVILPLYNGFSTLQATIQSILNQIRRPDELIIVNDGSTDDSGSRALEIINALNPPFRVQIVEQQNQGQSAARNTGIAKSNGELLAFIDQDDLWHPKHLDLLAREFKDSAGLGWAYSDFNEIDKEGRIVTRDFIRHFNSKQPKTAIYELVSGDLMVLPSASVIRRAALEEVGGFDVRLRGYEDDDLFISIFQAGWSAVFVPESLTSFRIHGESSSHQKMFRESRMIFFETLISKFPDDPARNRYYVSDLIAPRMIRSSISEYSNSLRTREFDNAAKIGRDIAFYSKARHRNSLRQKLSIAILKRPRLCRVALKCWRALPRFMRSGPSSLLLTKI